MQGCVALHADYEARCRANSPCDLRCLCRVHASKAALNRWPEPPRESIGDFCSQRVLQHLPQLIQYVGEETRHRLGKWSNPPGTTSSFVGV